jgi:hypothetical protein
LVANPSNFASGSKLGQIHKYPETLQRDDSSCTNKSDEELYNIVTTSLNDLNINLHSSNHRYISSKYMDITDLVTILSINFIKVLKRNILNNNEHGGIIRWMANVKKKIPNWRELNFEFECFYQYASHYHSSTTTGGYHGNSRLKFVVNFPRSPHIVYLLLLPSKKQGIGEEVNTLTSTRKNLFLVPKHRIIQSYTSTTFLQNHVTIVDLEIINNDPISKQNTQVIMYMYNLPSASGNPKDASEKLNFIIADWNTMWRNLDGYVVTLDAPTIPNSPNNTSSNP